MSDVREEVTKLPKINKTMRELMQNVENIAQQMEDPVKLVNDN